MFRPLVLSVFAALPHAEGRLQPGRLEVDVPRPFTIIQRDSANTASLLIAGSAPRDQAVEARFAGGAWQRLETSEGRFSGRFDDVAAGSGALEVRTLGADAEVVTIEPIGIGDVFVVTGQSNAAGQGTTLQRSHRTARWFAAAFREDTKGWTVADDPMTPLDKGSPWPLVANALADRAGVPLGFITITDSSKSVLAWQPGAPTHARVVSQIAAATGGTMRIKAVLWFQGEADMRKSEPQAVTVDGDGVRYLEALSTFVDDIVQRTDADAVVVGQSNVNILNDPTLGTRGIDAIRAAQERAWRNHPKVRAGPVTYDISLGDPRVPGEDFVHFVTDAEIRTLALRWAAALDHHFYGGADGCGPRLSAIRRIDSTRFELRFTDTDLPLSGTAPLGGFSVLSGGAQFAYDLTVNLLPSGDALLITCPAPYAGDAVVSLGAHSLAWWSNVVRDSSAAALPPVPFFGVPIVDTDFDVEAR